MTDTAHLSSIARLVEAAERKLNGKSLGLFEMGGLIAAAKAVIGDGEATIALALQLGEMMRKQPRAVKAKAIHAMADALDMIGIATAKAISSQGISTQLPDVGRLVSILHSIADGLPQD